MNQASVNDVNAFLGAFDGFLTSKYDRVVVIAATNRPDALDKGVLSRFGIRVYTPLPDFDSRRSFIVEDFTRKEKPLQLTDTEIE
jgi:spastin